MRMPSPDELFASGSPSMTGAALAECLDSRLRARAADAVRSCADWRVAPRACRERGLRLGTGARARRASAAAHRRSRPPARPARPRAPDAGRFGLAGICCRHPSVGVISAGLVRGSPERARLGLSGRAGAAHNRRARLRVPVLEDQPGFRHERHTAQARRRFAHGAPICRNVPREEHISRGQ